MSNFEKKKRKKEDNRSKEDKRTRGSIKRGYSKDWARENRHTGEDYSRSITR